MLSLLNNPVHHSEKEKIIKIIMMVCSRVNVGKCSFLCIKGDYIYIIQVDKKLCYKNNEYNIENTNVIPTIFTTYS